jgi:hypothetical protein
MEAGPGRLGTLVMMNFITDLPGLMSLGYRGILVIVWQLAKMAINLPSGKDIDWLELARLF